MRPAGEAAMMEDQRGEYRRRKPQKKSRRGNRGGESKSRTVEDRRHKLRRREDEEGNAKCNEGGEEGERGWEGLHY